MLHSHEKCRPSDCELGVAFGSDQLPRLEARRDAAADPHILADYPTVHFSKITVRRFGGRPRRSVIDLGP